MQKNLHIVDRVVRIALAALIVPFLVTGALVGIAGVIMAACAILFLGTALIGHCPLYRALGISSKEIFSGKE
jgi:hypothetical protein